ncbi:MAG: ribonuclease HI [Phycisphaerales bacterium]|nr:ribonuclease HI [Phycisphaerales bacterium]
MAKELPHVEMFTDGACSGNPGPGGWATILRHVSTGAEKILTGGAAQTTNNRMELIAVIEGLESLTTKSRIDLYSDSQYVVKGLTEWRAGWKKRGWRKADKSPVLNKDLWIRLDGLADANDLHCHWVRGHNDHPENEQADRLAVEAVKRYTGRD